MPTAGTASCSWKMQRWRTGTEGPAEAGNALWKLHRFAGLPSEEVLPILQDILSLIDEWSSMQEVFRSAVALAFSQRVTVYDACYLIVAGETGATLLTLDKKMRAAARELRIGLFPAI